MKARALMGLNKHDEAYQVLDQAVDKGDHCTGISFTEEDKKKFEVK